MHYQSGHQLIRLSCSLNSEKTGRFGAPGSGMEVTYDSEGAGGEGSRIVGDGDTIQE
ncbi:MAG: hypothetical protein OSB05_06635 [Akkermansiaceae bacterium]|nr:hypothetical protein [Akkermansiaceae bacterium]